MWEELSTPAERWQAVRHRPATASVAARLRVWSAHASGAPAALRRTRDAATTARGPVPLLLTKASEMSNDVHLLFERPWVLS